MGAFMQLIAQRDVTHEVHECIPQVSIALEIVRQVHEVIPGQHVLHLGAAPGEGFRLIKHGGHTLLL